MSPRDDRTKAGLNLLQPGIANLDAEFFEKSNIQKEVEYKIDAASGLSLFFYKDGYTARGLPMIRYRITFEQSRVEILPTLYIYVRYPKGVNYNRNLVDVAVTKFLATQAEFKSCDIP